MISSLGRLLSDPLPDHPQALLERSVRPGRSTGPLARALEGFFIEQRLALPPDHPAQAAARRRQRRIDSAPPSLRPRIEAFATSMISNRDRSRRAGTKPRADSTIEHAIAITRDLASFVAARGKTDWALVDVHYVEAFPAQHS